MVVLSQIFKLLAVICKIMVIFCACHENYDLVGTTCYKLHTTTTNWTTSEENCQQIPGYHLAKLENEEKHRELTTYLQTTRMNAHEAWIGLGTEELHKWKWTDGSYLGDWVIYEQYPWKSGEPSHAGTRPVNCARLFKANNDYRWGDIACNKNKKYLCSGPRDDDFINRESVTLLYDNSQWEFLMNRANVQCQVLKPEEDNLLIQTLFIDRLPSASDKKVNAVLYFDRGVPCEEVNILKILTENCSGKNYYEKCIVSNESLGSGTQKICSYDCPVRVIDDKITMSLIANPLYNTGNEKLCELEIFYTS